METTVKDLIDLLSKENPDAPIVIGYRPSQHFRKLEDGNASPMTGKCPSELEVVAQRSGSVMIR